MKVKNTLKKVGAVAGSALMVGMTMGAAQTLADFPQPFVGDDGTVASQIVVGSQGKVADVVGAVNLAASLGQSAVQTEEVTETVAGGGGFGWSATDGATLDTRNDNLYFGSNLDDVRNTLTSDNLDSLASTTFEDEDGDTTDVEYFLYPGTQAIGFGNSGEDVDPFLNVNNPVDPDDTAGNNLLQLQANFGEEINFSDSTNQDQELSLFGNEYTVSQDSTFDELILFGSSQTLSLDAGQSGTVTINDNEHTIELVAVNSGGAAYKVDGGTTQQDTEGETFSVDGETIRIDNVVNLNDDSGSAAFEVGSDELTLTHDDAIQDSDGNDVDGTWVTFDSDGLSNGRVDDLSTINVFVGAADDSEDAIAAGDSWSHEMFRGFQVHFGGLNPDAGMGEGENVGEVSIETAGDDTATVQFTDDSDESATVEWAFDDGTAALANGDQDTIHTVEGVNMTEDEYFASDAGDFSHFWRVQDIDPDAQTGHTASDEATVTLRDVMTGNNVEADLDYSGSGAEYTGTEVIDGQTYNFLVNPGDGTGTDDVVQVTWDSGASAGAAGTWTSVYTAVDEESGAALAFTTETAEVLDSSATLSLPSTESTTRQTLDLSTVTPDANVTVGQLRYTVTNATANGNLYAIGVAAGQQNPGTGGVLGPALLHVLPEDNNDEEHVYMFTESHDGDEINIDSPMFNGTWSDLQSHETDSDVESAYDFFGTHTIYDSDGQGTVTVHTPDGQAVAGAGITDAGGSLNAGGGTSTSVTYTDVVGMGSLPSIARLDTEVTESVRSNNHLILVGGPAVNTLVSTLMDQGAVSFDDLSGQSSGALISLVQDAFVDGQHALVVAGVAGSDTRAAAKYLGDYADHETALSDADGSLVLTESDYPSTY